MDALKQVELQAALDTFFIAVREKMVKSIKLEWDGGTDQLSFVFVPVVALEYTEVTLDNVEPKLPPTPKLGF